MDTLTTGGYVLTNTYTTTSGGMIIVIMVGNGKRKVWVLENTSINNLVLPRYVYS